MLTTDDVGDTAVTVPLTSVLVSAERVTVAGCPTAILEASDSAKLATTSRLSSPWIVIKVDEELDEEEPLDDELIRRLMLSHEVIITIEEGSIGGLGAHVLTMASDEGLTDAGLKIRTMRLPDIFQDHDSPDAQYDTARLNAPHIVEHVLKALRWNEAGLVEEVRA